MSKTPNDGGAAFPSGKSERMGFENNHPLNYGMTLRDYFAGQALTGALSDSGNISKGGITVSAANIANFAYMIADAMIEARGK